MALVLGLEQNESFTCYTSADGPIKVILLRTGSTVRIGIEAPKHVRIVRNTLEHYVSPSQFIQPNKEPQCPKEAAARNTSGSSSSTTSSAISRRGPLAQFFAKPSAD